MNAFKNNLVRLAYQQPTLRRHLLPLLRQAAGEATFRKTQAGEWVVMMPAAQAKINAVVQVSKKDGGSKTVRITDVRRPFSVNGKLFVYCSFSDSSSRPSSSHNTGDVCANCGDPLYGRGIERTDSSGLLGKVCRTCNRDSQFALSFA